ncbi:Stage VI sporulation protein F [Amphibacillus marinus]|uniref:Stage VI sporulation protein F n=1 Tax=Amphibacillus marinus TaxID=872970 RepID=A0A1H8GGD8_9BACI|nr:stage VI sporulation protein F [Amphibacillus marinus]SEN42547.1 Stage VI sporulation protein F [Amphibacillus marinus]
MNDFQKALFDQIQNKANIQPDEIFKVAHSVQNADFSDEGTVRDLVQQLSHLANKPIPKQKEDKLVQTIVNNNLPKDLSALGQLFKK